MQINLPIEELPKKWYNPIPDLPERLPPPKNPPGKESIEKLPQIMISECLKQERSDQSWIDIPEELQELYLRAGRPRPLFRARRLEEKLRTTCKLYYKAEFYSPTGSHKVNTALAQAWYAREEGKQRLATETGAGQWGTALAYASSLVGLECTVYWVRAVYNWKKERRSFMRLYGAKVHASPSDQTETGRKLLRSHPQHQGSLGIAVSEGLEDASGDENAVYSLGSVLNHVLIHQTVIGLETKKQFELIDEYPEIIISCLGGGSNFGGFSLPFYRDVLKGGKKIKFIAAQSEVAPNLQGEYKYDYADHAELTPLLKMYTIGHRAKMAPIKGDGLRYHGCAPILSLLRGKGMLNTIAYSQEEKYVFDRAKLFMQTEGFLPAPESAYSIACAIDEGKRQKKKTIAFNVSGHGFMDMEGYKEVLGL